MVQTLLHISHEVCVYLRIIRLGRICGTPKSIKSDLLSGDKRISETSSKIEMSHVMKPFWLVICNYLSYTPFKIVGQILGCLQVWRPKMNHI